MIRAQSADPIRPSEHAPRGERRAPDGVFLSDRYLSSWDDDVVLLDMSSDRHGGKWRCDLSQVFLRCTGPASPFDGVRPVHQFRELSDAYKALLNHLVEVFSRSSKAKSEVSRNFNAVVRFNSWALQRRGILRFSELTKHDFEEFAVDLRNAKHGILEITGCLEALDILVEKMRSGEIAPEAFVSSDKYHTDSLVIRSKELSRYLGVPIEGLSLPKEVLTEIGLLCGKALKCGFSNPCVKTNVIYAYTKALNRLCELPATVDRPSKMPYPRGYRVAVALAGAEYRGRGGRTENIRPDDAIKIVEAAVMWVYSYGPAIVSMVETARHLAHEVEQGGSVDFWSSLLGRANVLAKDVELPFEIESTQSRRRNGVDVVSIDDLTGGLMTACFCLAAINHGRRLNEIVGAYGLPGGLYFGCIVGESVFPGISLIDLYVEKTLKDWATFGANALVKKVVEVLESLAQAFRPLGDPQIGVEKKRAKARKRKLFRRRLINSAKAWTGSPTNFIYGKHSGLFFAKIGIESETLDVRSHPYRRIFSIVYYYRYEDARLLALSAHLRHLFPSTTLIYVTDPAMRKAADRLNAMYRSEQTSIDDDVRSEAFVRSVVEVLRGERAGGRWPQFVLAMYSKLLGVVEFADLEVESQGKEIASAMDHDGYQRITFYFGGCNVGQSVRTASQALCADEMGKPHLERACPRLCVGCVHHDSNDVTLKVLEGRAEALDRDADDPGDVVPGVRDALREEAAMLREVATAERALKDESIKILSSIRNSFLLAVAG